MVLPCWQRRWQRRRWRARGQQEPLCRCRVGRQRLSWRELRAVHIYQVGPGCRLQVAGCRMQVTVWCGERDGGGKGEPGPHPTRTRQRPTEAVRGSTLVQTTGCRCHSGARARTWGPPDARPDRLPEPRRIAAHLVSGEKSRSRDCPIARFSDFPMFQFRAPIWSSSGWTCRGDCTARHNGRARSA